MTVIFHKLAVLAAVLTILASCSLGGEMQTTELGSAERRDEQIGVMPASLQSCSPDAGSPFHFRKSILVAGTIGLPVLARDLPGLSTVTSMRLQAHLEALDHFNVAAMHHSSFKSSSPGAAARIRELGRDYESQFVVKIDIEDFAITSTGGFLSKLLGDNNERNIVLRLYIFDTEHGVPFYTQQYQKTVTGDVVGFRGNGNSVTTSWFETNLGKQVDEMLEMMSMEVDENLACVPFSTQVTSVREDELKIAAGYRHGIRPGETLRVYPNDNMSKADGSPSFENNKIWIKVNSVYPNHSLASVSEGMEDSEGLSTGDIVRAW
ncbi:hypothetical protein N9383_06805 [Granulosicoccus sp.]|nr:hypothetical protein [Granulosicoccus sp.]